MRLLCLIPAYNAGGTVADVVSGAKRHVADVAVVDDGSADDTARKAAEAGALVLRHEKNMGKGAALKTGFEYALINGFDAVVTLDADGQHDPEEIPKLVEAAGGGAGIVVGSRLWDREKIPPARYHTNRVGVAAIGWRAGNRLDDSQSGFRLYRAEVLRGMKYTGTGFEAETEFLIRAGMSGFKIENVRVKAIYNPDVIRKSNFRTVRDTYRICIMFLKSFFWLNP